jgi:hypothetical protein
LPPCIDSDRQVGAERGATNLLNAMKVAVCLLDLGLAGMQTEIRLAYRVNPEALGIVPVAAYSGGSRNVAKQDHPSSFYGYFRGSSLREIARDGHWLAALRTASSSSSGTASTRTMA